MRRLQRGSSLALALGLLGLQSACAKQLPLNISLVTTACVDPAAANQAPSPTANVAIFRFTVTVAGVAGAPVDVDLGAGTATLPLVPFDQPCQVEVEGLTAGGALVSYGNTGSFTVSSGTAAPSVSISVALRPVDSFTEPGLAGSATAACAQLTKPRAYHAQTLLPNGQVLIYGGLKFPAAPSSVDWSRVLGMPAQTVPGTTYYDDAELYDPATGVFAPAGSFASAGGAVGGRAFGDLIAARSGLDGGAAIYGGETNETASGALVGASGSVHFAPPDQWTAGKAASAHSHGCLAYDTGGDALLAGGLDSLGIATRSGEYISSATPQSSAVIGPIPVPGAPGGGAIEERADQGCSGFLGDLGAAAGLIVEGGGFTTDPQGQNATLLGDAWFYQFGSATFGPLVVNGQFTVLSLAGGARTRAKAAATAVIDPLAKAPSDAVLLTGGLTCDTGSDAGCAPTFADGGTSGQLGAPLASYFTQLQTELVSFPESASASGPTAIPTVQAGPTLPPRVDHCAVTLADGRVLVLGGLGPIPGGSFGTLRDALTTELSDGGYVPLLRPVASPLLTPRAGMACTLLNDGSVLVTGGYQTTGALMGSSQTVQMLSSAEIYRPLPLSLTGTIGRH